MLVSADPRTHAAAQAASLRRTLGRRTPEDGNQASWLASWEPDSWRPEYQARLLSWSSTAGRSSATRVALRRLADIRLPARSTSSSSETLSEATSPPPFEEPDEASDGNATSRGYLACHSTTATAMDPRTATV